MTDKQLQEEIRTEIAEVCYKALAAHYGTDKVRLLTLNIGVNTNGKEMKKNTVIVETRETKDKDGFNVGIVCSLYPTVHRWNSTTTAKKTTPAILMEDIDIGIETAKEQEKEEKKEREKKEKAKQAKIKKDFERRAKGK